MYVPSGRHDLSNGALRGIYHLDGMHSFITTPNDGRERHRGGGGPGPRRRPDGQHDPRHPSALRCVPGAPVEGMSFARDLTAGVRGPCLASCPCPRILADFISTNGSFTGTCQPSFCCDAVCCIFDAPVPLGLFRPFWSTTPFTPSASDVCSFLLPVQSSKRPGCYLSASINSDYLRVHLVDSDFSSRAVELRISPRKSPDWFSIAAIFADFFCSIIFEPDIFNTYTCIYIYFVLEKI